MHACVHASLCRVEQVADPRLDEDRPGPGQQLLAGHPGQATIGLLRLCPLPQRRVGLDEAYDLEVVRSAVDGQLARARMAYADLADLDPRLPLPVLFLHGTRRFPEQRGSDHAPSQLHGRTPAFGVHDALRVGLRVSRARPGD